MAGGEENFFTEKILAFCAHPSFLVQCKAAETLKTYLKFVDEKYDAVFLIYNQFKSAINQEVTVQDLLPVSPDVSGADAADYIYEPSAVEVLESLVPRYVATLVWRALLESVASEHGARMTAMDSATKNAVEIADKLTLDYNRARQAAITQELMEIISGAAAISG